MSFAVADVATPFNFVLSGPLIKPDTDEVASEWVCVEADLLSCKLFPCAADNGLFMSVVVRLLIISAVFTLPAKAVSTSPLL